MEGLNEKLQKEYEAELEQHRNEYFQKRDEFDKQWKEQGKPFVGEDRQPTKEYCNAYRESGIDQFSETQAKITEKYKKLRVIGKTKLSGEKRKVFNKTIIHFGHYNKLSPLDEQIDFCCQGVIRRGSTDIKETFLAYAKDDLPLFEKLSKYKKDDNISFVYQESRKGMIVTQILNQSEQKEYLEVPQEEPSKELHTIESTVKGIKEDGILLEDDNWYNAGKFHKEEIAQLEKGQQVRVTFTIVKGRSREFRNIWKLETI
jgi:hypothetical protein